VIWLGGPVFAVLAAAIALLGMNELYSLAAGYRPLRWAGHLGVVLIVLLAWSQENPERGILLGLGATLGLVAVAGLVLSRREEVILRVAVTLLGAVYLGFPFGVLVAARELPDGAGAVVTILAGTWAFDTASYLGGRAWGRRPIAPRTSPGKTVEGALCGLAGGVLAVWVAGLYMDWIDHVESLVVGIAICVAAYLGDLFESLLKRDAGVKDSGRLLLGHGGVLDRFDSLLFSSVAGYVAIVGLVY
jgi:phosphatidate cytidylyltransferase